MTLTEYQEQSQWGHAETTFCWRHVVFYHAARGDLTLLHERRSQIAASDTRGILAYDLVSLADNGARGDALLDRLAGETDLWVFYTLAKHFLAQGLVSEAFRVAKLSVPPDSGEGGRNTCVLNLIVKYLVHCGSTEDACDLIGGILKLNAKQQDLAALRARLLDGERPDMPLHLGVLPRRETVTAYVPVHNGGAVLGGVLDSFLGQSYPLHEFFVIDDGSTDGSVEVARLRPVQVLEHGANRGLSAARNTAFRAATGRYVAAIDADVVCDIDMLKFLMMEFENALPAVGGVGARLIEQYTETLPDRWRASHLSQDPGEQRIAPIDAMSGAKTLFLREAVLAVGGFNERYRTNYEDVDVCQRLRDGGYELATVPYAIAGHLRRDTATSVVRTAWNYVFWATHGAGYYASRETLVELLLRSLRAASEVIQWDATNGNEELLYLDFLYLVTVAFCDLEHAVKEGAISAGEARGVQEGILELVRRSNATHGDALAQVVCRDTRHLLVSAEAEPVRGDYAPYLDVLGCFLAGADDGLYAGLLALGR